MKKIPLYLLAILSLLHLTDAKADDNAVSRGRYLTIIGGCNDCHTAGFAISGGKIPEKDWMLGEAMGWRGPWGTTYPINVRKLVRNMTREEWISLSRNTRARPPMPGYILSAMTDQDLGDMLTFLQSLGDGGQMMPAPLPPGVEPVTPYFNFIPVNLPPAPGGK